ASNEGDASLWEDIPDEDSVNVSDAAHGQLYDVIFKFNNFGSRPSPRKVLVSPSSRRGLKSSRRASATPVSRRRINEEDEPFHPFPMDQVGNGPSTISWAGPDGSLGTGTVMEAIGIKKIRRKKMNKHKWKKRRRLVRDSSRYNKEKRKKSGPLREKHE
ncbi:hypothetical protein HDU67_005854, partial [Dinochytrium kinnereticum]